MSIGEKRVGIPGLKIQCGAALNKVEGLHHHKIEFSAGSVEYNKEEHHNLVDMLQQADLKMYDDKKMVSDWRNTSKERH